MLNHKVGNKIYLDNKGNDSNSSKNIKKCLIVNFDVNNTIIYYDSYSKQSIDIMIKINLSKILFINLLDNKYYIGENIDKINSKYRSYYDIMSGNKKNIIKNILNLDISEILHYFNQIKYVIEEKIRSNNLLLNSYKKFIEYIKIIKNYDIKIVFRTFGVDGLPFILQNIPDCKYFGRIFRLSDNEIKMKYKKIDLSDINVNIIKKDVIELEEFNNSIFDFTKNNLEIIDGYKNISNKIDSILDDTNYMFIRDDWSYWNNQKKIQKYEIGKSGKIIFPIKNTIQLFFDDGINENSSDHHIVSIRNNKFIDIPYKKDIFIFNVSILCLLDDNYYINKFKRSIFFN
jgi:hypothetical protein